MDEDDGGRYLNSEQQEERRWAALPWWKKGLEGCIGSLSIAIAGMIGIPIWWLQ